MKKIVLALILLSAFAFVSNAQNEKFFRFGMHVNSGITWMKSDEILIKSDGLRIGLGWGFIGELTIADNFSFATGFDVNYMGGKLLEEGIQYSYVGDTTTTLSTLSSKHKMQFLDLPLTIKMKTNEINYITYFLRFGGSAGVRLSSKPEYTYNAVDGSGKNYSVPEVDVIDESNFLRFNVLVGAGLEYSMGGSTSALVEVSFVNGLLSALEKKSIVDNYIMLKLGIIF